MSDEGFLKRWSRLKTTPAAGTDRPTAGVAPAEAGSPSPPPPEPTPPPPVESLTPESDFAPFMRADIDRDLRANALKKLFADPRFNVMDGLDVYIDDYSKPDPLPEGWLEKLNQVARLGAFQPQEADAPEAAQPAAVADKTASQAALPAPETDAAPESSNAEGGAPFPSKNRASDGS